MHLAAFIPMFALFSLGRDEIVLILAVTLVLLGSKFIPNLARRLGDGFREFKNATLRITDHAASEAGRSAGGIYGKRAAEALTPDSQVAELYDPAVFQEKNTRRKGNKILTWLSAFFRRLRNFFDL